MQKARLDKSNSLAHSGPSEVVSHYLEAIYYIWQEGEAVRSARLADWLSVSRPTVTVAVRRMSRAGLVPLNPRKHIQPTPEGRPVAESTLPRPTRVQLCLTYGLRPNRLSTHCA